MLAPSIKRAFHDWLGEPLPRQNPRLHKHPDVVYVGRRSYIRRLTIEGKPYVKKTFTTYSGGRLAFARERLARRVLKNQAWMPPWHSHGFNWYVRPWFPERSRLDQFAAALAPDERRRLAGEALSIVLDLYVAGLMHRDFHARNLYYVDGGLKLVDYEAVCTYEADARPHFQQCYDITGRGADSPFLTGNMCYASSSPYSLKNVLGVDLDDAKAALVDHLKTELRGASLTFQTAREKRHTLRSALTYNTFDEVDFQIGRTVAQRDCQRRFERFGIDSTVLAGKRLLDIGSNIGGMSIFAQRYRPQATVGVEYDADKVRAARRVASFCGYPHIRYIQADVDAASPRSLGGRADVVFCFALEGHVRKPRSLYRLLGSVTGEVLYFEANAGANRDAIDGILRRNGFKYVEWLGLCDDDILEENNRRLLCRAFK